MRKPSASIDGFVPRRSSSELGEYHSGSLSDHPVSEEASSLTLRRSSEALTTPKPENHGLTRTDVDESLRGIDEEPEELVKKRGLFGRKKLAKPTTHSRRRKWIKRIVILLVLMLLAVGIFIGVKAILATSSVFKGNFLGIFQNQPLKEDANGRSNILIFGTSEDDPGHEGGLLTDSLMVLSVNQSKKDAYMVSIPRDLYVKYNGEACSEGYQGKINSMYDCFSNSGSDPGAGANALKQKIGEIVGLDVQYYAHLNYGVVRQAVDAVGGVEVKIESDDPRGILDRNFDWKCRYQCYYVKYANGETAKLDGEHALALARARNAAGGYGLTGGNFDREQYQQKIIKALREKAVSAGTLANVGKVTGLIDALGTNLKTNFDSTEIRTLMTLGNDIPSDKIISVSLVEEGEEVMTTGNLGGASIVQPVAGLYDYSQIAAYIKKQISSDPFVKEEANIAVYNGSTTAGLAQKEADKLTDQGFVVSQVANAAAGSYGAVEIYQLNDQKSATKAKLLSVYGVTPSQSEPPFAAPEGTDFIVIIGRPAPSRQ